jgi:lipopolysaccharide export LptBFGC system permease protein LptF
MADEATLAQTDKGTRFLLTHGIRQEKRGDDVSWLNFDRYTLDVSFYNQQAMQRERGASEQYLPELFRADAAHEDEIQRNKRRAEGHQRLLWPWYSFSLPLVAIALLTSGEFSRRGMWKRLVVIAIASLAQLLAFFGLMNLMVKTPFLVAVSYALVAALIVGAVVMLARAHGWNKRTSPPRMQEGK